MITFLTSALAGHFFKTAAGEIKAGWEWLFSSATHILEALLAVALLWGWLGHHGEAKYKRALTAEQNAHKADNHLWSQAFTSERDAFLAVKGVADREGRAIKALGAESAREIAANHAASQKLAASQHTAEALSARMKAAFASSGAQAGKDGQCASDPTVVAGAKGGAW